jgi:transposase
VDRVQSLLHLRLAGGQTHNPRHPCRRAICRIGIRARSLYFALATSGRKRLAAPGTPLLSLILEFDRMVLAWHRSNQTSKRVRYIPGVGPMQAAALVASVGGAQLLERRHSPLPVCLRELFDARDQAIEHGARVQ